VSLITEGFKNWGILVCDYIHTVSAMNAVFL